MHCMSCSGSSRVVQVMVVGGIVHVLMRQYMSFLRQCTSCLGSTSVVEAGHRLLRH